MSEPVRLGLLKGGQFKLPGIRCFCELQAALDNQTNHKKDATRTSVLFAVQSSKSPSDMLELRKSPKGCRDNRCEYDTTKLGEGELGAYNFATAIQDKTGKILFWEWVASGASHNPDLNTRHTTDLPAGFKTTMYCSVEIAIHKYAPPRR